VQYTSVGEKRISNEIEREKVPIEQRKGKFELFFYCFNPIVNLQKLFYVKEGGERTLFVLNGVRVLSICWVAMGHAFSFVQFTPISNYMTVDKLVEGHSIALIAGGVYAVDTFFFLSGFLTFYLLTLKAYKKKGKINWLLVYFHRYYRLVFPVAFVMFFAMYVFPYLADGPFYRTGTDQLFNNCKTWWWSNLLFINNFAPFEMAKQCIGWVWYLANDFQFFIISPPIIYAYCKNRSVGYILTLFFILTSMIVNGTLSLIFDISIFWGGATHNFQAPDWMYIKPWSRMGAYFVGAIFGFAFFEYVAKEKMPELAHTRANVILEKIKTSRIISLILCIIGIGLTAVYVFPLRPFMIDCGQQDNCWSRAGSFFYNLTTRTFFVLGIGFILLPTFLGRLSVIKSFLNSEPFAVLARLNYMVYMIHILVIFWFLSDQRSALYANELNLWFLGFGAVTLSFIFAIPFTLLFEAPFLNIEKYILFPAPQKEVKRDSKINSSPNGDIKDFVKYKPLYDEELDKQQEKLIEKT
jgi:peptidoglycan/LPS O-acetylase OafA/YrhL